MIGHLGLEAGQLARPIDSWYRFQFSAKVVVSSCWDGATRCGCWFAPVQSAGSLKVNPFEQRGGSSADRNV
jgi:hypothetical protein